MKFPLPLVGLKCQPVAHKPRALHEPKGHAGPGLESGSSRDGLQEARLPLCSVAYTSEAGGEEGTGI